MHNGMFYRVLGTILGVSIGHPEWKMSRREGDRVGEI